MSNSSGQPGTPTQVFLTIDRSPYTADFRNNHASRADFLNHADLARDHLQKLVNRYPEKSKRSLTLDITSCADNQYTEKYNGASASFNRGFIYADWANDNLSVLLPMLTHEIGHYFRGPDPTDPRAKGLEKNPYFATSFLLQEATAEALVFQEHGLVGLHHNRSVPSYVWPILQKLVLADQKFIPYNAQDQSDWDKLIEQADDLYSAVEYLRQASKLEFIQLVDMTAIQFNKIILPIINDLV